MRQQKRSRRPFSAAVLGSDQSPIRALVAYEGVESSWQVGPNGAVKKMTQTIGTGLPGLAVFALSNTQWRISDATRPESDGLALLAFVEQVGSLYEVTELAKPSRRTYFSSLSAALDSQRRAEPLRGQPHPG